MLFGLEATSFWIGAIFGAIAMVLILSLVLPDRWAAALVTRRNIPVVLLPIGLLALILGGGNLITAFGWAVWQALGMAQIASWVWWLTLAGAVLVVLFFATRRWHDFHIRRTA